MRIEEAYQRKNWEGTMKYGFSILMFCFSAGLLLYAGIIAAAKDPQLIPRHYCAKIKNKEKYAVRFAKVLAVTAIAPFAGGITGLIWNAEKTLIPSMLVLILAFSICMHFAVKIMDNAW